MVTSQHFGVHAVSGAALLTAINSCVAAISGMRLVPTANGQQIAVIGTGIKPEG